MSLHKLTSLQTPSSRRVKLHRDDGAHKGKVHLALFGFKHQTKIDIDTIIQAIDALPNAHLEGLSELRYDPTRETQRLLNMLFNRPHVNRFKAEYVLNMRSITLYELPDTPTFLHILYHEMGHHVFCRVVGSQLKKEWVREIYPKSRCVTFYGKRNASEDFAESYAYYKLHPQALMQIPEKYWFMKEKVFKDYQPEKTVRDFWV